MSRLTSSDTCNAVFDVVHFGTYARAYAVRQASRSPTAPINGETHTQVRRGVFRPTLSTLQASSQWRWSGSLRPRRQACVFGPRERVVRAEYRPAPITFPSVPGRIARCGCDRTLRLYAQELSWSEIQSPIVSQGQRMVSPAARISNARAARALCRAARRSEQAIFSLVSRALVGPKSSGQIG